MCERKRAVVYALIARLCNVPEPLHYSDQRGLSFSAEFLFNKAIQNGSHATDWTPWQDASQPPKKIYTVGRSVFLPEDWLPKWTAISFPPLCLRFCSHVCYSSLSMCEDIPYWLVIYLEYFYRNWEHVIIPGAINACVNLKLMHLQMCFHCFQMTSPMRYI